MENQKIFLALNLDLKLQLSDYLFNQYAIAWVTLLKINKDIYLEWLYTLRKYRYILSNPKCCQLKFENSEAADEIQLITNFTYQYAKYGEQIENIVFADKFYRIYIKLLLKYNIPTSGEYEVGNIIRHASHRGELQFIKYILNNHKPIIEDDIDYINFIIFAIQGNRYNVIRYLLPRIEINTSSNFEKMLEFTIKTFYKNNYKLLRLMLFRYKNNHKFINEVKSFYLFFMNSTPPSDLKHIKQLKIQALLKI